MDVLRTVEQSSVANLVELLNLRCLEFAILDTTFDDGLVLDMTWLEQVVVEKCV